MREIRFKAEYNGMEYEVSTRHKPRDNRGSHNFKGRISSAGYWLVMVENHPLANSRGYYPEHRLVMERKLGRFLGKDEVVHHIDKIKKNNEENNLQLVVNQSAHASLEDRGKRNPNGTMVAADPKFSEIKYRLFDVDRNETFIYTLSKLINTTFRKGKFQYRGTFTGLHDKNNNPIYEGDIVKCGYGTAEVIFMLGCFMVRWIDDPESLMEFVGFNNKVRRQREDDEMFEVIGNIYESPLIK